MADKRFTKLKARVSEQSSARTTVPLAFFFDDLKLGVTYIARVVFEPLEKYAPIGDRPTFELDAETAKSLYESLHKVFGPNPTYPQRDYDRLEWVERGDINLGDIGLLHDDRYTRPKGQWSQRAKV